MQLRTSKRRLPLVFGLVFLLLAGGGVYWWWSTHPAVAPTTQNTAAQPTPPVETKPQPVMVKLPGAAPITAIIEDYDSDGSLWRVVSKDSPFTDSHYVPANLELATVASRTDKSNLERSLRKDIMPATETLFAAAKAQGYDLMIGSGYRSYEQQTIYYTNYVKTYGQAQADTFSAQPGKSEHQTGLAFDIAYTNRDCYLDACFGDTPAGQWLAAHAYEYGFILRYPKDKTDITKYIYEPWHFRYVGTDLARALHGSGLTLDEARLYLQEALTELKKTKAIP